MTSTAAIDLEQPITHAAFARIVGISRERVGQLVRDGTLSEGGSLQEWLIAYCGFLRNGARTRAGGPEGLIEAQARVAEERAEKLAMENAVTRGELAPRALLEAALADAVQRVVPLLEGIPAQVKRASSGVKARELALIRREIDKARAAMAEALIP